MTDTGAEKLKLMVVDDELDNLELLYRTFRRDFQVFRANNALSALEILDQEGEMAVIISDQRMPEMNGTEFLSLTVERFPDTIRILLTGFTDVEDLVDAINSGQVFKYITKPWKPDRLRTVVEQATDTYRVVKKRTQELQLALRRESLFNVVTTAIRESLDYRSMLEKIVATIGESFEATCCLLRPIEGNQPSLEEFVDHQSRQVHGQCSFDSSDLIAKILESRQYNLSSVYDDRTGHGLVVPLTYQQQLLAVLVLCQHERSRPWQKEDVQLIAGVAEQASLALSQAKLYQSLQEKQKQISTELEVARQIQNNLLRQSLPEIKSAKVQACCFPAREVGGDFFEVFSHPKGDLWLAVGDVSGKGVPAALFMASVISVLRRELSQENPPSPNRVMANLNLALFDDLMTNNCFITLVLVRYTPTTKELVCANAGHIYPLCWSRHPSTSEHPIYLKTRGIPLGIKREWKADIDTLTLQSGDALLLASDGVTEAMITPSYSNRNGKFNGSVPQRLMLRPEGLWELLKQQPPTLCLEKLLAQIQADSDIQEDDQTILSLEVF
ncbi:SpoIIE family protein phosphatase [Calothrix sp. NIES-3974]|uniref:SpoIIE family protein phosphatase n=1 Tax=Calothrix sp. NIES-3974 TaxID=2005462 RepID=UPI000B603283|nr:SpoIIE family protein phosphatase [Calothrix sp. NIES-3974]BAZ08093.1 response regulator receiver modulated serine phosphatase with GAF sensor [Calothrix sp. NIES-3974]